MFSWTNSLERLKLGYIKRRNLVECQQALTLIYGVGKAGSGSATSTFYSRLVEVKRDDDLVKTLGFYENQLNETFQRTFVSWYLDNYQKLVQKTTTLLCLQNALPV